MKPDRSDFEIWVADWLAGNLSADKEEQFIKFLEQHPDLKDETGNLSLTTLYPGKSSFRRKDTLKRNPADLGPSQVEFLSIAYLEKDITPGLAEDLNNCIKNNPDSRKIFESVRKTKLVPPDLKYPYKVSLKKKSRTEIILYLVYPSLRIAAVAAIIALFLFFIPKLLSLRQNEIATENARQSDPATLYSYVINVPDEEITFTAPPAGTAPASSGEREKTAITGYPVADELTAPDSGKYLQVIFREPVISGIADLPGFRIDIFERPAVNSLVASNIEYREPPYDDRNGFSKFLARVIREKLLKEDTGSDAPVKPYEIASAGINGISRLFGLEMALVKVSDEQGEIKSLYFSSRLLKINAPVKNDEASQ